MTDKEQGALNTLIFEKQNQIEELELSITENKMKIKTYRDNIRQLESDIERLKKMYRRETDLDIEALTREYEEQKEKERLHLLKANAVEVL
ncbi:hypothetical protein VSQ48_02240 [Candidatus Ventrimonas sp. KK005]